MQFIPRDMKFTMGNSRINRLAGCSGLDLALQIIVSRGSRENKTYLEN